jgi:hypothetical protein
MSEETYRKFERQIQATQARRAAKLAAGDPATVAMFNYARKGS